MKKNEKNESYSLRILVDSGGCSGFQYNFEIINDNRIKKDEDYIFVSKDEEVKVVIDDITMNMINHSTIDYKSEMIRSSFEVQANPNAELGCSCGVSFSPKKL